MTNESKNIEANIEDIKSINDECWNTLRVTKKYDAHNKMRIGFRARNIKRKNEECWNTLRVIRKG